MVKNLRPIDLARLVGVSTQQIRNYLDAAVLPPADRTLSGYRKLDDNHRQALLTYRSLGAGYGWDTAQVIMRTVHEGDTGAALALIDESHAALHEERRSLEATGIALEAVAEQTPALQEESSRINLPIGAAARRLGVRASTLRTWEAAGLLAPSRGPATRYRAYRSTDLRDAQMIRMLRLGRYRLEEIAPILEGLHRTGSTDALRTAIAQRQLELTDRARHMLEASSRLHNYLATE